MGIDPGNSGGISFIQNKKLIDVIKLPTISVKVGKKNKNFADGLKIGELIRKFKPNYGIIEKVGAMPGQGVVSMFSFGYSTGIINGCFLGNGIKIIEVRPHKWKKIILEGTDKDKQSAIDFCKFNFPNISLKPTPRSKKDSDGLADSICIGFAGLYIIQKEFNFQY